MSDNFYDDWVEGPDESGEAWLFSWGFGQEHPNRYVRIEGTFEAARQEMNRRYGPKWAMQYPESAEANLIAVGMRVLGPEGGA